jgi:hypothetical protein
MSSEESKSIKKSINNDNLMTIEEVSELTGLRPYKLIRLIKGEWGSYQLPGEKRNMPRDSKAGSSQCWFVRRKDAEDLKRRIDSGEIFKDGRTALKKSRKQDHYICYLPRHKEKVDEIQSVLLPEERARILEYAVKLKQSDPIRFANLIGYEP